VGWALLTSRDVGQIETRLEQQAGEIMETKAEIKALNKRTQSMEINSAKIETKLEILGEQLTRIESMLNSTFAQIK
jgi:septal ring factor EnvC (AmiA/AmiB activator)